MSAVEANGSGKVKQTRRRQRLSCVECTRRRQKCDRQTPCTLCVSRGIPHLCRWESIVARPAPQKPPEGAPTVSSHQSTIFTLSARIAVLEQTILRQNLSVPASGTANESSRESSVQNGSFLGRDSGNSWQSDRKSPGVSESFVPSENDIVPHGFSDSVNHEGDTDEECALARVDADVQLAAAAMAQLSVAPSDEYIGSGTLWCALHKLGDPDNYLFPVSRSLGSAVSNNPFNNPLSGAIEQLIADLPSREIMELLIDGYFAERSWEFGVPERWFRTTYQQMWLHLDLPCVCQTTGSCGRCTKQLNPHWLTLLFAVLALAPRGLVGDNARVYFWKAMEARRLVEDIHLSFTLFTTAPSQVIIQGAALSCIAAALLASYLADHGRVSDAWKLTGTALRNAQAVGLHRDPGWQKWEKMDRQESELRLVGWWFLIVSDRIYSLILGRPTMASEGTFDVKLVPGAFHGDGSQNPSEHFHKAFIGLMQIIDEAVVKCFGPFTPSYATVMEIDRKFKFWHTQLHPSLDWRKAHAVSEFPNAQHRSIIYQRHLSATYYLGGLMNLHRLYLMHPPPILPPLKGLSGSQSVLMNPSRERCIDIAIELVRVLCDAHAETAQWDVRPQIPLTTFHYAYFVFDGAVALVGALSQDPPHPKARECLALIERAIAMLEACRDANKDMTDGSGDTASRGIVILAALRKAGRWDERFGPESSIWKNERSSSQSPRFFTEDHRDKDHSPQSSSPQSKASPTGLESIHSTSPDLPVPGPSSFAHVGARYEPQPPPSIPFLNASHPWTSSNGLFPLPGPMHAQPSSSSMSQPIQTQFGETPDHLQGLGATMGMDFGDMGSRGSVQTIMMPFDMLRNSDNFYDIDWAAVMGSELNWLGGGILGLGGGQSL